MKEARFKCELNCTETKGSKVFKGCGERELIGHLCLFANWPYPKKKESFLTFSTGGSFTNL